MGQGLRLSASKLGLFKECPRCFWDAEIKGQDRPRGKFPSLPNGIDKVVKVYLDQHRGSMPVELSAVVDGTLYPDLKQMQQWRNWRTGLKAVVETKHQIVEVIGALDDLVLDGDKYSPFDIKTKGSPPTVEDALRYYQLQQDTYGLLLDRNGMVPTGHGYLFYLWPIRCGTMVQTENPTIVGAEPKVTIHSIVGFGRVAFKLPVDPARAVQTIGEAAACLAGDRPPFKEVCEYCRFVLGHEAIHVNRITEGKEPATPLKAV